MSAFFHAEGPSNFNTFDVELHCYCSKQQPTITIMVSELLRLQGFAGLQVFQFSILLNSLGPQNTASWFFGQDTYQTAQFLGGFSTHASRGPSGAWSHPEPPNFSSFQLESQGCACVFGAPPAPPSFSSFLLWGMQQLESFAVWCEVSSLLLLSCLAFFMSITSLLFFFLAHWAASFVATCMVWPALSASLLSNACPFKRKKNKAVRRSSTDPMASLGFWILEETAFLTDIFLLTWASAF